MNTTKNIYIEEQEVTTMNPKKFIVWLGIVSIIMLFAALTSGYIVRQGDVLKEWLVFDLPSLFYWSTGIILLSSVTMHWAYIAAKKNEIGQVKIGLIATLVLGIVFLVTQVEGWGQLVDSGVFFAGAQSNPAGSFIYVISGLHAAHIIGGLVFLIVTLIKAMQSKVHSKSTNTISMCMTFWHFLDLLWVYLFVFFFLFKDGLN
ncbi:heme/copper-type cytochrome/quinol oxidase, subunit 3 [Bernardetia litoralis DSM 6794]|uniref:Heme/copper-type cytochrome/quinol oxidase, subunit 3 n=1 Tax=Bernardetia litoralis (strain ATCC 23117 / DSM 6794 / NBRC 15988 / NCIMB 1366 / Fx l1 / Sio-4) TaxID=880071 RepID=I4AIH5_BERLS|nr:cytochrome c oxidase subunit 3 [Bernardetia litoralis]AFM03760.1 heme/copper-type cytochrome/quinol oxidase, subunit 3 [Bernardetia litoralis DSM 6794]